MSANWFRTRLGKMVVIAGIAVAALAAASSTARAERKRVGVPKFEGPQEAAIRGRVMKALKGEGYEIVRSRDVESAVRSTGASLDSDDGFKAVAKELSVMAFVTGEIVGKKARLAVRSGADGGVIGEAAISAPTPKKLAAEVGKGFWKRLGSAVERGKLPSGAKTPPKPGAAEPEEEVAEAGDDDSGAKASRESSAAKDSGDHDEDRSSRRRSKTKAKPKEDGEGDAEGEVATSADEPEAGPRVLPWVDAAVGFRGFSRNLTYNQDIGGVLRGYKLAMGPAAAANIALYPFLLAGMRGPLGNLAIEANIEQGFGITSQIGATANFPTGATFPTTIHEYAVGARYRIPLDTIQLFGSVTGGEHAFAFHSPSSSVDRGALDIPDTIYRYIRPGVAARFEVVPAFSILVGAGYRYVFNGAGQIRDGQIANAHFPHLTVGGIDANIGAAYKITPYAEARLSGDLRRYFYSMHSTVADVTAQGAPGIAGGAVDQYLSVTGLLAFMY